MRKEYILIIDSGVGGVSVLKKLKNKFITESFIYVADNKNSPFGNKTKSFLFKNTKKLIDYYINRYKIKLIIFACNTISVTILKKIKKYYNIPIIGCKPPINKINSTKKTLVLSTERTLKSYKLFNYYKKNNNITFIGLKNVAKMLDENFFDRENILNSLKEQIKVNNYENVVLGCTHYYFLKREIKKIFNNKQLIFFDGLNEIIKKSEKVLIKTNKLTPSIKIFTTKSDKKLKKTIKFILNK